MRCVGWVAERGARSRQARSARHASARLPAALILLPPSWRLPSPPVCDVCTVLADVARAMLAPKFVEELFKPQEIYGSQMIRGLFDQLAHSSIMRLNENSMDKVGGAQSA